MLLPSMDEHILCTGQKVPIILDIRDAGLKRVFYRLPSLYEQKICHKSTLTSINCHLLKALSVLYNINTI